MSADRAETAGKIRTGRSEFDDAFTLLAREGGHAQQQFASTVADEFVSVARNGWQISATDNYVQIRIGGDYSAQFPEKEPGILSAALDNAVHCAQSLIVARRALPLTAARAEFCCRMAKDRSASRPESGPGNARGNICRTSRRGLRRLH